MAAGMLDRIDITHAQLLIVDVQERLLRVIPHERLIENTIKMVRAARLFDLHITITEQNSTRLGPTHPRILQAAEVKPLVDKLTFSVCADEGARTHLTSLLRPQVLIAGIETHVCVQQTALDLLAMQMRPVILADAVASRHAADRDIALAYLRSAGAIVTTVEAAIFALQGEAGTDRFRKLLDIIK